MRDNPKIMIATYLDSSLSSTSLGLRGLEETVRSEQADVRLFHYYNEKVNDIR